MYSLFVLASLVGAGKPSHPLPHFSSRGRGLPQNTVPSSGSRLYPAGPLRPPLRLARGLHCAGASAVPVPAGRRRGFGGSWETVPRSPWAGPHGLGSGQVGEAGGASEIIPS